MNRTMNIDSKPITYKKTENSKSPEGNPKGMIEKPQRGIEREIKPLLNFQKDAETEENLEGRNRNPRKEQERRVLKKRTDEMSEKHTEIYIEKEGDYCCSWLKWTTI